MRYTVSFHSGMPFISHCYGKPMNLIVDFKSRTKAKAFAVQKYQDASRKSNKRES